MTCHEHYAHVHAHKIRKKMSLNIPAFYNCNEYGDDVHQHAAEDFVVTESPLNTMDAGRRMVCKMMELECGLYLSG